LPIAIASSPRREGTFDYGFGHLAQVIEDFVEVIGLTRYALYIFGYGTPNNLRLAMAHPERVNAIVTRTAMPISKG
jgi:pimeloyl-ACP methyl ester carboxylesterase